MNLENNDEALDRALSDTFEQGDTEGDDQVAINKESGTEGGEKPPHGSLEDCRAKFSGVDFENGLPVDAEFIPEITGDRETRHMQKLRYDLVPAEVGEFFARVAGYGAGKYNDWNWLKGMPQAETYACAMRHMQKWWAGQNLDEDEGEQKGSHLPHLWHALWNIGVMAFFERHRPDLDNRPIVPEVMGPKPVDVVDGDVLGYEVEVQLPAPDTAEGFVWMQQGDRRETYELAHAVADALRGDGYGQRVIRIMEITERVVLEDNLSHVEGVNCNSRLIVFPGDPDMTPLT